MQTNRINKAFELFDNYNSRDIKKYIFNGLEYPQELFFAKEVYKSVLELNPEASEALLLASRCQHIGRWEIPRESYPDGKAGYLNWRSNLAKYHAEKAAEILTQVGYEEETIQNVKRIVLKQQLKTDPEVQTMENALCLVFLQFEYEAFLQKHSDEKIIRILQKTWGKMTQPGRDAALKLNFSEKGLELIKRALN